MAPRWQRLGKIDKQNCEIPSFLGAPGIGKTRSVVESARLLGELVPSYLPDFSLIHIPLTFNMNTTFTSSEIARSNESLVARVFYATFLLSFPTSPSFDDFFKICSQQYDFSLSRLLRVIKQRSGQKKVLFLISLDEIQRTFPDDSLIRRLYIYISLFRPYSKNPAN